MRALDLTTWCVLLSCIWLAPTHTQAEEPTADNAGETQIEGATITIELPPDGKEIKLPMNSQDHATLVFDMPVADVVGKPQGAVAHKAKHRGDQVDIWPEKLNPEISPGEIKPLAGNFRVELKDRTLSVSIFEPADLKQAIHLVKVRSTPGKVEILEREVEEAKDDARSARLEATEARREASEAMEEARKAAAKARVDIARANAKTKKAEAETAQAKADAAKARAEAAIARADAAEARAQTAEARAQTAEAKTQAKEAKAVATDAEVRAMTAQESQKRARYQMLATAARDLTNEQVQRLVTKGGTPKRSSTDRLDAVFHYADWKNRYYLFETKLTAPLGQPFHIGGAQAVTSLGRILETHIIDPEAPEDQAEDARPTVYPNAPKRVTFAVKVPPGESTYGLKLRLTEHNSETPPITFQVPNYNDVAVALLVAISDEESQRRRWANQIVIGPRLALGGCWLVSGLAGDDEQSAARCTTLGVSVIKGLRLRNHDERGVSVTPGLGDLLAAGFEVVGSLSEDAQFDRAPSELTRSIKLFRAVAFGDVRFSRGKIVPYLRVGTGVQATRYSGNATSETDMALMFAVGGGAIFRLGENISAGLTTQFTSSQDSAFQSLDAGIHLSYGWNR